MCLHLDSIPAQPNMGYLVKCRKHLGSNNTHPGRLLTPYRLSVVPLNGLLMPTKEEVRVILKRNDTFTASEDTISHDSIINDEFRVKKGQAHWDDVAIEGGCIHAYSDCSRPGTFDAYALRLFAYGNYHELTCLAMYIPEADMTKKRQSTIEALENILSLNRWPKESDFLPIINRFPRLRRLFPNA